MTLEGYSGVWSNTPVYPHLSTRRTHHGLTNLPVTSFPEKKVITDLRLETHTEHDASLVPLAVSRFAFTGCETSISTAPSNCFSAVALVVKVEQPGR